jgi:hypothetical protein
MFSVAGSAEILNHVGRKFNEVRPETNSTDLQTWDTLIQASE